MGRLFKSGLLDQAPPMYDSASRYSSNYPAKSSYGTANEAPTWDQLLFDPLEKVAMEVVRFIPDFIIAIFTLLIGWVVAKIVEAIVSKFLKSIGFDKLAHSMGITELLESDNKKVAPHGWFGKLAFWLIMLFTIISTLSQFNLYFATRRLNDFFYFLTNSFTTLIILLLGIFISVIASKIVHTFSKKLNAAQATFFANITKWTILIFTFLMCLAQIGVPAEVVLIVMGLAYVTLCITFIIAFGSGGRSWASKVLDKTLEKK